MSRFPEFKGLDPKVFIRAAKLGARKGEGKCVGACHLLAENLVWYVTNPYSEAMCAVFEPTVGIWRPAFFLAYTRKNGRYQRLPNDVIFERRQLVLLLCAELTREANAN